MYNNTIEHLKEAKMQKRIIQICAIILYVTALILYIVYLTGNSIVFMSAGTIFLCFGAILTITAVKSKR